MGHFIQSRIRATIVVLILLGFRPQALHAQQTAAATRQPTTRILAHYMPWYEAKPVSASFGWHWTMNTFDPGASKSGRPGLASHYRPLIGPYDSGDPDVLEYHGLLMKLAGIDGVIIDWYGTSELFDYAANHRHAAAFAAQSAKTGLDFAVCYEDQTIPKLVEAGRIEESDRVAHAQREIEWLREQWFAKPSYLKLGGKPILLSFGRSGLNDAEWEKVLAGTSKTLAYLSEHNRRTAAMGAFDWPSPEKGLRALDEFYATSSRWPAGMAVAFPRYHDIYEEARVHKSWGRIDDDHGKTFVRTLERALRSGLPLVQISTWNDWGEGTIIEPSVEFGYRDLEVVQRLRRQFIEPGFEGNAAALRLPHRLFKARKAAKADALAMRELDQVFRLLNDRSVKAASEKLDSIERRRAG
jgi:hypothetical protein